MYDDIIANLQSPDADLQREGAFMAAENESEAAVPLLVGLLSNANLGVQEAAEQALRKIGGRRAVEELLPLLRSDHPPLRNLGMDLLRALGGEHLDLLLPLLHDTDTDIRIFMSDILGSSDDVQAVKPLCDAMLHDPEVNVRYQAAVSLGELARPEAAKSLNQALGDDEWVQFAVIEALMKIRDESSINALVRALDRSSELVRSMIIDALGEMGNIKAAPLLMKRLDSAATALRNKILRAIVRIMGGKSLSLLSEDERLRFGSYLVAALDDEDADIQDAALIGLGFVGQPDASGRILDLAETLDPDHDLERVTLAVNALAAIGINDVLSHALHGGESRALVTVMALEKLGSADAVRLLIEAFSRFDRDLQRTVSSVIARKGGEEAKDFFIDVLGRTADGTILKQALLFLGAKLRAVDCVDQILTHLEHPYNDVKEAALDAAVAIGTPEVAARFASMAGQDVMVQRLMGVYGLGQLDARTHRSVLIAALGDESPDVRKIALEALGEIFDEPGVPEAALRMAHDEVPDVRLALVEILGRRDIAGGEAYLFEALADDDDWVRIRAIDALAGLQKPGHAIRIIPLLEDGNHLVVIKAVGALGRIGGQAAFRALLNMLSTDDPEIQGAVEQALDELQRENREEW